LDSLSRHQIRSWHLTELMLSSVLFLFSNLWQNERNQIVLWDLSNARDRVWNSGGNLFFSTLPDFWSHKTRKEEIWRQRSPPNAMPRLAHPDNQSTFRRKYDCYCYSIDLLSTALPLAAVNRWRCHSYPRLSCLANYHVFR